MGVAAKPSVTCTGWAGPRPKVSVVVVAPAVTDETTELVVAARSAVGLEMNVGRKEMGHTKQGKKDRDQQSLVHRHIAYPGSHGGPGVAGERSLVRALAQD